MARYTFHEPGGAPLSALIRSRVPAFAMPCSGRHTCGKCAVPARGALGEITPEERALLDAAPRPAPPDGFAWRMACMCKVYGVAEVDVPDTQSVPVAHCDPGALETSDADEPGTLGAAIDIGTTTVSLALFDLERGVAVGAVHELNAQAGYGADVLSRIEYANAHGARVLSEALLNQIAGMMDQALRAADARPHAVRRACLTGNTTMLHFLTGLDPRSIGVSPFTPLSLFGGEWRAPERVLPPGARAYLPRSISAYVGADITCGILATGMCAPGARALLVDVGTNGEMALWADGRLTCCATAAGPAFEGAQISMGMPARPGAVRKVAFEYGRVECLSIGEIAPVGLCGTGLISVVDGMVKNGVLDETGRIGDAGHAYGRWVMERDGQSAFVLGESGVVITQKDVRAVQLAKAAICAGIETLLNEAGCGVGEIDALYLSGGFGSNIDPVEAAGIGLIPRALAPRAKAAGNTALAGAARMLLRCDERVIATELAERAIEIQLANSAYFMDRYVENMMFE